MMLTLLFALSLAACISDDAETSTTQTTPTETAGPVDPGRLVVLDASGDIVVIDPDGSVQEEVTTNGGETALYAQPVWSPDASTLAWGQVTEDGFAVGIQEPGAGETTTVETSNLPFYIYWSPDGSRLGVLHNGSTGVEFRMVDVAAGTSQSLDEDTPFYFSWSPDSDEVVTHAGEMRVETIRPGGERLPMEPTAGTYLAPQWTTAGVFHVVDDQLVLEAPDGERTPVAAVAGFTMFVSNPQGTMVALQTIGDGGAVTAATEEFPTVITDSVVVVDVATGETDVVSNTPALGFFWSPDGESLLVLSTTEDSLVPRVWVGGEVTSFEGYVPPPTMLENTFPFFPQYAQSVSFWAADSSAFAYAGSVAGETGVWVQTLDQERPAMVSDGSWVAWSGSQP